MLVQSRGCGALIRSLRNLKAPCKGVRVGTFCGVQKVPQKHAEGCDPLDSRGRFKALSKKISAKFSDDTSRNRFFAQDGGEKALNRCEVPALQRKELERRLKEKPCSLRTVGYGWVGMGDGGWKRVAWGGDKKGFLQMKTFSVCAKGRLLSAFRNVFCKRKRFCFAKKAAFSIHAKPTDKEKLFFSTAKFQFRTAPKLTCSHKFHL